MMRLSGKNNPIARWMSLFRLPNLAIIALTQYLLGYGIIRPVLNMQNVDPPLDHLHFFILAMVSLLIAAAGYLINDHFDVNTDRRNKPGKNMLEGKISVRKALNVYYTLNILATAAGFYLAYVAGSYQLGLIFPAIIGLLWFYSSRYQRMAFWGNFIIALLSSMVILIVWLFEFFMLVKSGNDFVSVISQLGGLNKYVFAYALFAFMLSMIREVLKDIQDMKGDMATGFRTIPVVWGVGAARTYSSILIIITIALLGSAQWFLYSKDMIMPFWYLCIAVQSLFVYLLIQVLRTKDAGAYGFLSNTAKIIMLAGILSMELIYISF